MDEYEIIHHCHMNSLAETLTTDVADITALNQVHSHGSFVKQSFSSESYSSYPTFNSANETSHNSSFERPAKQLKITACTTNSWNSTTTASKNDRVLPRASSSSSPTKTPHLLSFENSSSNHDHQQQFYHGNMMNCTVKPKDEAGLSPMRPPCLISNSGYCNDNTNHAGKVNQGMKRAYSKIQSHAQDHIVAERKRREKLSQRFIALSAIVPGLKKVKVQTNKNSSSSIFKCWVNTDHS